MDAHYQIYTNSSTQKCSLKVFDHTLDQQYCDKIIHFIQTQDNMELIDDKDFRYDNMNLVHRFLVHCK